MLILLIPNSMNADSIVFLPQPPRKPILRFIELHDAYENRRSAQEVREHVFWMLRNFETKQNTKSILKLRRIDQVRDHVCSLK